MSMFDYTCEGCLDSVWLTDEEAEEYRHHDGWLRIRCDECLSQDRPDPGRHGATGVPAVHSFPLDRAC